jgi:hypothetical protein
MQRPRRRWSRRTISTGSLVAEIRGRGEARSGFSRANRRRLLVGVDRKKYAQFETRCS